MILNPKIKGVLNRLYDNDHKQTLGHFILYDGINIIFECKSLELPNRNNQRNISRINAKWYQCELRYSKKYSWHFHVLDVEGRSWILIHFGNYYTDIRGCILLGNDYVDINGDGHLDVTSSRKTIRRLLEVAPKRFNLLINDLDKPG
ncbi:DUF5675 family protein [uncultured Winogradskyella sp.]|uniref:DUF5675 family protein n=1 Tax=uncultured Winogradskyella sp. TaxID=395353 RepID=UPI00262DE57B|nr:DUF5675 family protein [uncultured Winogradskyella sp.]